MQKDRKKGTWEHESSETQPGKIEEKTKKKQRESMTLIKQIKKEWQERECVTSNQDTTHQASAETASCRTGTTLSKNRTSGVFAALIRAGAENMTPWLWSTCRSIVKFICRFHWQFEFLKPRFSWVNALDISRELGTRQQRYSESPSRETRFISQHLLNYYHSFSYWNHIISFISTVCSIRDDNLTEDS